MKKKDIEQLGLLYENLTEKARLFAKVRKLKEANEEDFDSIEPFNQELNDKIVSQLMDSAKGVPVQEFLQACSILFNEPNLKHVSWAMETFGDLNDIELTHKLGGKAGGTIVVDDSRPEPADKEVDPMADYAEYLTVDETDPASFETFLSLRSKLMSGDRVRLTKFFRDFETIYGVNNYDWYKQGNWNYDNCIAAVNKMAKDFKIKLKADFDRGGSLYMLGKPTTPPISNS